MLHSQARDGLILRSQQGRTMAQTADRQLFRKGCPNATCRHGLKSVRLTMVANHSLSFSPLSRPRCELFKRHALNTRLRKWAATVKQPLPARTDPLALTN